MCFPALLPRSIHFPFNHFMMGLRVRLVESTLTINDTSLPVSKKHTHSSCYDVCFVMATVWSFNKVCVFIPAMAAALSGFCTKSPVSSVRSASMEQGCYRKTKHTHTHMQTDSDVPVNNNSWCHQEAHPVSILNMPCRYLKHILIQA